MAMCYIASDQVYVYQSAKLRCYRLDSDVIPKRKRITTIKRLRSEDGKYMRTGFPPEPLQKLKRVWKSRWKRCLEWTLSNKRNKRRTTLNSSIKCSYNT